ncbi:MAG: hypothetical protein ACRCXY_11460 [Fusobacteriaceae bacterium]
MTFIINQNRRINIPLFEIDNIEDIKQELFETTPIGLFRALRCVITQNGIAEFKFNAAISQASIGAIE